MFSPGVVSDPLSALEPLQPPDAVQVVTFAEVHVRVVVPPGATPRGDALRVTDGDVAVVTLTVARATAPPPGPLQFNVKVVFAVIAALVNVPFTARLPVQPLEAVQVSALLVDQDNVVVPPEATLLGLADRLIVGGL